MAIDDIDRTLSEYSGLRLISALFALYVVKSPFGQLHCKKGQYFDT